MGKRKLATQHKTAHDVVLAVRKPRPDSIISAVSKQHHLRTMHGKLIWFSRDRKGWKYKLIYEILILKQYSVVYVDMRREVGKWDGTSLSPRVHVIHFTALQPHFMIVWV